MKITIITVVYNNLASIKKTLRSVIDQVFSDYEYIVIDGASKDGTLEELENWKEHFKNRKIVYQVVSEMDTGIYNAMNKGIKCAKGDMCIFLNAGDTFVDNKVLMKVSQYSLNRMSAVIVGDTLISINGKLEYSKARAIETIIKKIPFCHQSVFIPTTIMKKYLYDEKYKIASDYDFFIKCYINKISFVYIDLAISIYDKEGISSNNLCKSMSEIWEIKKKYAFPIPGIVERRIRKLMYCCIDHNILNSKKIYFYLGRRKGIV